MAYFHLSQIESLGKVESLDRESYYFKGVVVRKGEQSCDRPFPKSDYLRVEGDSGFPADDSDSYRDIMDFQREWGRERSRSFA